MLNKQKKQLMTRVAKGEITMKEAESLMKPEIMEIQRAKTDKTSTQKETTKLRRKEKSQITT